MYSRADGDQLSAVLAQELTVIKAFMRFSVQINVLELYATLVFQQLYIYITASKKKQYLNIHVAFYTDFYFLGHQKCGPKPPPKPPKPVPWMQTYLGLPDSIRGDLE